MSDVRNLPGWTFSRFDHDGRVSISVCKLPGYDPSIEIDCEDISIDRDVEGWGSVAGRVPFAALEALLEAHGLAIVPISVAAPPSSQEAPAAGSCSVAMWGGDGSPAGLCGAPAYGRQAAPVRGKPLPPLAIGLACPSHGGPAAPRGLDDAGRRTP